MATSAASSAAARAGRARNEGVSELLPGFAVDHSTFEVVDNGLVRWFVLVLLLGRGRFLSFDPTSDGGADGDPLADDDGDGVPNGNDLCVGDDAIDTNANGVADACDPCVTDPQC